ncbi:MAG: FAD/NAD(P)-binding oxidoreductase [Pseudomonadota bacterium]
MNIERRDFLKSIGLIGAGATVGTTALAHPRDAQAAVKTQARIVIVGGGAGGLTAAAKLNKWLDGARITIVEPRETHWYQPGWVFVGAGVHDKSWTTDTPNADYIPDGVRWVKDSVATFEPEANKLVTGEGETLEYDFLIVATGLKLDYEAIEGLTRDMLGKGGLVSVYASPDQAEAMWTEMQAFIVKGGDGIFTLPHTPLKCAGAPLKMGFLTESHARNGGRREALNLYFNSSIDKLFSVKPINDLADGLFRERGFGMNYHHRLKAVDTDSKEALFATPDGDVNMHYDFLHIVPPMTSPDVVKTSALAWQEGPFAAGGWLEVDKHTLQHLRFPNVFGVGDVNGTPIGKTAASVKFQAPIAAENLVSLIEGKPLERQYDGYTSCPLVTGIGKAALVEFGYDLNLVQTFPFVDQAKPSWAWWALDLYAIKPLYEQMLKGRVPA